MLSICQPRKSLLILSTVSNSHWMVMVWPAKLERSTLRVCQPLLSVRESTAEPLTRTVARSQPSLDSRSSAEQYDRVTGEPGGAGGRTIGGVDSRPLWDWPVSKSQVASWP